MILSLFFNFIFLFLIGLLVFFINKLVNIITNIEQSLEECVDILESSYKQIYKYSKIPVFYNEPVIKGLLQTIRKSQESIIMVTKKIENINGRNNPQEEEKAEED